jgi:hypothetical protein
MAVIGMALLQSISKPAAFSSWPNFFCHPPRGFIRAVFAPFPVNGLVSRGVVSVL